MNTKCLLFPKFFGLFVLYSEIQNLLMGVKMSAITGILHFNEGPIPPEHQDNLMRSFKHYPSDDIDIWSKTNIFLGCHAQWITPESIGEKLPYYDYERQLVITAD